LQESQDNQGKMNKKDHNADSLLSYHTRALVLLLHTRIQYTQLQTYNSYKRRLRFRTCTEQIQLQRTKPLHSQTTTIKIPAFDLLVPLVFFSRAGYVPDSDPSQQGSVSRIMGSDGVEMLETSQCNDLCHIDVNGGLASRASDDAI
jgi:hypothetical protein